MRLFLFLVITYLLIFPKTAFASEEEQTEILIDKIDIQENELKNLSEDVAELKNQFNFRFFGSLALRNCYMTEDLIRNPADFIINTTGNSFQTRLSAGIKGNIREKFSYQFRVLSIEPDSWNLPWIPLKPATIRIPVYFDRYSVGYQEDFNKEHSLIINIGRNLNFMPESELLFDEDVSFTGLTQQYLFANDKEKQIFKGFSAELMENFLLNEGTFNTVSMFALKLATDIFPTESLKIRTGTSFISYLGIDNMAKYQFFQGYTGKLSKRNNVSVNDDGFVSDFNILNYFLKMELQNQILPVEFILDYVHNFGASEKNNGYLIGFNLGTLKKNLDWKFGYNFKQLEQDYHLSFFVQDQMGGTDVSGHEFNFNLKVAEKTTVTLQLQNRKSISSPQLPDLFILYSNIRQDF